MQVPGYTEVRELGHGGTGRVMLAVRDSDGVSVAIKHLSEQLLHDEEFVTRFREEALVIREIDSPHTARLLEYVEGGDDAVIVMELVDGVTLRRLLEHEGSTGPEAALAVLKGALLGLAEAHRHDVVHRDFKPENVIVTGDGDSRLVDFGVAAHSGETAPLLGTPSYMAPEQWEGAPASPATDVYAASVVFFECLTGHRPFLGGNLAALAFQHQNVAPPVENVEEPVRGLVGLGLAKDPADRPASAQAFLAELEATAAAAYGSDWERRGRAGLGLLTVPHTALLPMTATAAESGTSLFGTTLAPATKLLVTGGLIVATAIAVITAFGVWNDAPKENVNAFPPPTHRAEPSTAAPPSAKPTPTPSPTTPEPSLLLPTRSPTEPAVIVIPPTGTTRPAEPAPTRTQRPEPTRTQRPQPTRTRTTPPPPTRTTPPPPTRTTQAPPTTQRPPTRTSEPPPPVTREPQAKPLLSVSVKVSLDVPVLSGKGDGLLDADIGLGLGTGLLGSIVVGGGLAARRVRRPRDTEKT